MIATGSESGMPRWVVPAIAGTTPTATSIAPRPASTAPVAQTLPLKRPASVALPLKRCAAPSAALPLKRLATPQPPASVHSSNATITVTSRLRTTGAVQNSNQNSPGPRSAHAARNTAPTIGCVYLYPRATSEHDVSVQSWVRASHAELNTPLADAVASWP